MGLVEYRRKRDFSATPEPRGGGKAPASGDSFVIQKHAARRLHYDFRLELDGVLKSWAVPKGPSFDPDDKRLAVEVEDHPLEYGGFEGNIPKGEYGGGAVLLWDRGRWEPVGDPREGYKKGKLKFKLFGKKLHGGFSLVRMHGRAQDDEGRTNWLLIKEHDEHARPHDQVDIVAERPDSVASRRVIEEIAADTSAPVWKSNRGAHDEGGERDDGKKSAGRAVKNGAGKAGRTAQNGAGKRAGDGKAGAAKAAAPRTAAKRERGATPVSAAAIEGSLARPFPREVEPQLATLVTEPPSGDGWIYEMKLDGYRVLARLRRGEVELVTRRGQDWTERFPVVRDAIAALPARDAVLDGEVVVMRPDGVTDFQALQNALRDGLEGRLLYYAFDLMYLDGRDLRPCPLTARKEALAALLADAPTDGPLRYSEHLDASGAQVFDRACTLGLEGVIAKRGDAPYLGGRVGNWLKVKCGRGQEFVIVGFTDPGGARTGLGAILVGVNEDGKLRYAGKVGTGFSDVVLRDLHRRLAPLERPRPAFVNPPRMRGVHWVEPKLVAQIRFAAWTRDGRLRHASFEGLREDRPPSAVVVEKPLPPPAAPKAPRAKAARRAPPRDAEAAGRAPSRGKAAEFAGVHLTHPDKVLYPEQGITKGDLARYYLQVADRMLPYIARRLLTLVRCPEGEGKPCFYQRHEAVGLTEHVKRKQVDDPKKKESYLYVEDTPGLLSLVQMGALEIHTWGSHVDRVEQPDMMVFDLDPAPDLSWDRVAEAARTVRTLLETLGLQSFAKTTGGKGLHVVVPIQRRQTWDEVKAFTKAVAEALAKFDPKRYVATMSKAKRTGKVFVDYLRNGRSATAVAPYSTRARKGAAVAVPISWAELDGPLDPSAFTIASVPERLASTEDPWAEFFEVRQSITSAMMKQVGL